MSHTYLIDLYDLIELRLGEISSALSLCSPHDPDARFLQGRCDILIEFKQFLAERYNEKLPRRIKNRYTTH